MYFVWSQSVKNKKTKKAGLIEIRTRVTRFKVWGDNQLHYQADNFFKERVYRQNYLNRNIETFFLRK